MSAPRRIVLAIALVVLAAVPATAGAATHTYTYRFGPYLLAGYSSHLGTARIHTPPVDGFITYMHSRVVDSSNHFVPQQKVMLHHVAYVNQGRFDGDVSTHYCHTKPAERFYGTGEEDQSLLLPPGYGYPVHHNDRWRAGFMVMNHRFQARKVWIQYTLTVSTENLTPVKPYWIGVEPCLPDPIFNVPGGKAPGATYTRSFTWPVPMSGRIVAVGAHLHGGSKSIILHEPSCGDRVLTASVPEYGLADDPIYHVLPQIHEPGPRYDTYSMSATGVPITKGENLRLDANYDGELPHARVMGIIHIYVAAGPPATLPCPPLPTDTQTISWDKPFRAVSPRTDIPITVRAPDGRAMAVTNLPGSTRRLDGGTTINVEDLAFSKTKLSIPLGAKLQWRFRDPILHDVTTANGPRAFGSQYLTKGRFARSFNVPGTYRLYCTFHPADMSQIVVVRPR